MQLEISAHSGYTRPVRYLLLIAILGTLPGCFGLKLNLAAPPPEPPAPVLKLTPGAQHVRVGKSDAPEDFEDVGTISVSDGEGCGMEGTYGDFTSLMIKLKNAAVAMGAQYVQLLAFIPPHMDAYCFLDAYSIEAIAYRKSAPVKESGTKVDPPGTIP